MKTVKVSETTGRRIVNLLNRVEHGRGGYFGATGTAIPPITQPSLPPPARRGTSSTFILTKITAHATAGGCYTLVQQTEKANTTISSTATTLTLANYYENLNAINLFGINLEENTRTSTHDLPVGIFCYAELRPGAVCDNGDPVVIIRAIHRSNCGGT